MSGPRRSGLLVLGLRWLMWSRRRALVVLGLTLVVLVAAARALASPHTATAAAPPPPAAPSATASPTAPACPPGPSPPAEATPIKVTTEFTRHWVDHQGDPTCWLDALQPWSTDAYGQQVLPTVDPSTVPADRVTGAARLVSQQGRAAEVTVPLDGLTVRVSLLDVSGHGGWRVNDLNPDTSGGNP